MANKQKKNKESNLHLIKPLWESENSSNENPTQFKIELEERINRIEKELKKSIGQLEKKLHQTLKKNGVNKNQEDKIKLELNRLNSLIQNKIHSVTLPIKKSEKELVSNPPKASYSKIAQHYFNRIFSLKTYKRFLFGLTRIDREEFDEFGRDPAFEKKVKPLFDFLYHRYWRVSVDGLENIPNHGRGLIVANHSGTLPFDGSMIRLAVTNDHPSKRDVRFLVEDFVYYLPFVGSFMYKIGGVRASPDNAERLLNKNHLVTVFPEGEKGIGKPYKQRYHLQRFGRGGFIKLALRTRAPIIPCAVIGAEETHPLLYKTSLLAKPFGIPYVPITATIPWLGPLGIFGLPAKWHVYFGKPILLDDYGEEAIQDELLIHRLSEQVRQTIQEMVMEGLKKRRSIWWG